MATTITIGENGSDYNGYFELTWVNGNQTTTNYNSSSPTYAGAWTIGYRHTLVRLKNLSSVLPAGVTITSAKLYIYAYQRYGFSGTHTYSVYRILKDWVDSEATYNNYATGLAWNTAGLGAVSDSVGEDSTADRTLTPADSSDYDAVNLWYSFDITDLAGAWFNGAASEYGVVLIDDDVAAGSSDQTYFYTENDSDGYRPYFEITYEEYSGYFSGYVYEIDVPVSRKIYVYNRDTGALVNYTTSSGDGYYYIETTYSGAHYIVALDDESGESYNAVILDKMVPETI